MNILLTLCIFITVFSQIPSIEFLMRPLMYVSWSSACIYALLIGKGKIYISWFSRCFIILYLFYLLYCAICSAFGAPHFQNRAIYVLLVPLLLCMIGDSYAPFITKKQFQSLAITYLVVSLFLALWFQITYFPSLSAWLYTSPYFLLQKNAIDQILVTAILVSFFLIQGKTKWLNLLNYGIRIYLIFFVVMCHCRTAILGLLFLFFVNIVKYAKHRVLWIFVIIAASLIIFLSPSLQYFAGHIVSLNNYEISSVNELSSGRLDAYIQGWKFFMTAPWIGVGKYLYTLDNSYLLVLVENGVLGFILIESIWLLRIIFLIRNTVNLQPISPSKRFIQSTLIFYMVESCLEGLPPFGPGASSFIFWFFTSLLVYRPDLVQFTVSQSKL